MIDKEITSEIMSNLPPSVKLVAVSKFKPVETVQEAYDFGLRDFGENRPQELNIKSESLPEDIRWHFIGHLQTNKIKMIIDKVACIHSVDSLKLLRAVNKEAVKRNLVVDCLLQAYIASEDTKQGMSEEEIMDVCEGISEYRNVRVCGLMGMASFVDDKDIIAGEFRYIRELFNRVEKKYFTDKDYFKELSIGMSGDYKIALEHGATMVRVGSLIFGARI